MEIGGYIEISQFEGNILHEDAISLNSARNCLAYLIECKNIKKIVIPKFLCDSVEQICKKYNLEIRFYSIGHDFLPEKLELDNDEWLYIVNYYGQIENNKIEKIKEIYGKIIVDNVQAYFQEPVKGIDTIYTCRKYFGVPDGAFLYTDTRITRELIQDKSADRMLHLLGRYESSASEYYSFYTENEKKIENLPLRKMSELTKNLLRGINYNQVKSIRERNYLYLDKELGLLNKLKLTLPDGPFMYPLYVSNGGKVRQQLQKENVYIATLWPDVFDICETTELEYNMAKDILPLPCDQRYDLSSMKYLVEKVKKYIV